MRRTKFVNLTATVFGLFVCVGCSREPAAAPAVDTPERERTKFFTQLAAEPDAGALRERLQTQSPDLELRVGRAGPAFIRAGADQPWTAQVEVQLVVQHGNFEEARARLLGDLAEYLRALAKETGTEIGAIQDAVKEGKMVGFRFEYKTVENTGSVTVGPEEKVLDSFLVIAAEWR